VLGWAAALCRSMWQPPDPTHFSRALMTQGRPSRADPHHKPPSSRRTDLPVSAFQSRSLAFAIYLPAYRPVRAIYRPDRATPDMEPALCRRRDVHGELVSSLSGEGREMKGGSRCRRIGPSRSFPPSTPRSALLGHGAACPTRRENRRQPFRLCSRQPQARCQLRSIAYAHYSVKAKRDAIPCEPSPVPNRSPTCVARACTGTCCFDFFVGSRPGSGSQGVTERGDDGAHSSIPWRLDAPPGAEFVLDAFYLLRATPVRARPPCQYGVGARGSQPRWRASCWYCVAWHSPPSVSGAGPGRPAMTAVAVSPLLAVYRRHAIAPLHLWLPSCAPEWSTHLISGRS
jgi:hypothetical protein